MKKLCTIVMFAAIGLSTCRAETIFLDNHPGVVNGSTTYDPETRTCGQGKYPIFTALDQAARALADADVLYVRAGTYSRGSVGKYIEVHGNKVNYWTGALAINASGTPKKRKLVAAYKDELVVIQCKPGVSNYNPDVGDTTFKNSSHYFPQPAISVDGAYLDIVGFKTYGQVVIRGHDVTLQGCDLGGGGPHMNQGQVVAINSNREGGVYNVVIRNNRIHHSCWGESAQNGAAIMGYNFSAVIENNEFYDNYGADIRLKDCGGQQGRTTIIRNNLFRPTSINPRGNHGLEGIGQDGQIDYILIHNNIFYRKRIGIQWDGPAMKGTFAYNNTFIDCDMDISQWFKNARVNIYNNLHYHSKSGQRYYQFAQHDLSLSNLNSDYNLFFSIAGDSSWFNLNRNRGSTLVAWQKYSGKDENSVWKDPLFMNPMGSKPEDFKRQGLPEKIEDVVGSKYGPVCGAYVTGDEVVGLLPKKDLKTGSTAKALAEGSQQTWSFEDDRPGAVPEAWKAAGPMATWQVIEDKTAPSGKKVLALTSHKRKSNSVRDACWTDAVSFLHAWCSLRHLLLVGIRVAEHLGLTGRAHSLSGFAVSQKPVVVHLTLLFRYTTDHHRSLLSSERIVIDLDRRSRDVRAVLPITSPVHVKTMAQRYPEFDVMPGHITVAGSTCACDRVPIPVEQVVLDQRR